MKEQSNTTTALLDENGRVRPAALQAKEAAAYIRVSITTFNRLTREGHFRPNRVTQRNLFLVSDLNAFLVKQDTHPSHRPAREKQSA